MLSRSSTTAYSCRRQLGHTARAACSLQSRASSTSAGTAPSGEATQTPIKRSIPLAQRFGNLIIPDTRTDRRGPRAAARQAAALNDKPLVDTLAARLARRQPGKAGEALLAQVTQTQSHLGGQQKKQTPQWKGAKFSQGTQRAGGNQMDYKAPQPRGNFDGRRKDNQRSGSEDRRPRRNKPERVPEEPEMNTALTAENFAIHSSTDLDSLFGSSTPTSFVPAPRKSSKKKAVAKSTEDTAVRVSAFRLQHVLERVAGDYSRYHPQDIVRIRGDSVQTLGPVGLAKQIISRKAEVGLKSKETAIGVVSKLAGKVVADTQVAAQA
ncbi:unnamed protein product [Somion occarium]|uniref:Uncharacterized protein n=1 Tax=Somion occarium TaxID=3059160 RepID=A0ABP1CFK6_9APHY